METKILNFLIMDRGDDLRNLTIDSRGEKYRLATDGQAIVLVGRSIPLIRGGNVMGIANVKEVTTSLSDAGNVMTYITFTLTKVSKEVEKGLKTLYAVDYTSYDGSVPGVMTADKIDALVGLKGAVKEAPKPKNAGLSSLPSSKYFDTDDEEEENTRNRRRTLFSDI